MSNKETFKTAVEQFMEYLTGNPFNYSLEDPSYKHVTEEELDNYIQSFDSLYEGLKTGVVHQVGRIIAAKMDQKGLSFYSAEFVDDYLEKLYSWYDQFQKKPEA